VRAAPAVLEELVVRAVRVVPAVPVERAVQEVRG
jgi:hypothetical protein